MKYIIKIKYLELFELLFRCRTEQNYFNKPYKDLLDIYNYKRYTIGANEIDDYYFYISISQIELDAIMWTMKKHKLYNNIMFRDVIKKYCIYA